MFPVSYTQSPVRPLCDKFYGFPEFLVPPLLTKYCFGNHQKVSLFVMSCRKMAVIFKIQKLRQARQAIERLRGSSLSRKLPKLEVVLKVGKEGDAKTFLKAVLHRLQSMQNSRKICVGFLETW